MQNALWRMTAAAQAAAVRDGEVTAVELVDAHLERIAEANPAVNAVTQLLTDRARADAAAVDLRRAAGDELGPLAGVPFTVKETTDIEGVPTTYGAERFRDSVARTDAPPVSRLRAAGGIPIGHSNMPTLILAGVHTRSELFGDTANPWSGAVTPGGTSGGDGAAVATGMAAIGLGNDSGGSVRIPASFCGVAALKPTYGRFAADHRIGPDDPALAAQVLVVDGPLARTVGDLRLAYEALAGADPRDPRAVPVPPYGEPPVRPLKVAMVTDPGGQGVHPVAREAVESAADALRDAGYEVHEVADVPRLDDALEVYGRMTLTEFATTWPWVKPLLGEGGHRYIELGMANRAPVELTEYLRLTGVRLGIRRDWAAFLDEYPLVLGPVFTDPPFAPGEEARDAAGHQRVQTAMRLCTATSFVGVPSVAVPTGVLDGLPSGVQMIGRAYREDLCLEAAEAVELRLGVLTPIDPRP
ncbi:amidase [Streptomyces halobius]|uniref:Indole acetimide hydrolase n=1 Tax=Streptomyces halobius TaxID=2879846 RepID=A0ABY4M4N5_9ACTN|nr:amidase [Streptomyces halobius]UQA92685.1 indole acetimide hydrolase [Streptomyces halobius]